MAGHHASGALGLDPLDRLNQKPRDAHDPDRKDPCETQLGNTRRLLLQPQSMHRSFVVAQRRPARTSARSWKARRRGKIEKVTAAIEAPRGRVFSQVESPIQETL